MKTLLIALIAGIFLSSCDIMKSITLINKTHHDISLVVETGPDRYFFDKTEKYSHFHLEAEGKESKITMLKGFGKWGRADAADLADIITISKIYFGNDSESADLVNPDFLKVKRTGIFGSKLKIVLK